MSTSNIFKDLLQVRKFLLLLIVYLFIYWTDIRTVHSSFAWQQAKKTLMVQGLNGKSFLQNKIYCEIKSCLLLRLVSVVLQIQKIFCTCTFYKSSLILPCITSLAYGIPYEKRSLFLNKFFLNMFCLGWNISTVFYCCDTKIKTSYWWIQLNKSQYIWGIYKSVPLGFKF